MNSELRRRLRRIEAIVRRKEFFDNIEANLDDMSEQIEAYAAQVGVTPEYFRNELYELMERRYEIGDDAFFREYADEMGIPAETMLDPVKRAAWLEGMEAI